MDEKGIYSLGAFTYLLVFLAGAIGFETVVLYPNIF